MKNEVRTSTGEITRIHVDRRTRDAGYLMGSHHCHPYFELSYIEHGSCRFFVEDTMYDLHDGDFLLIPPQVFHYTRYLFGPCLRCGIYFRLEDLEGKLLSFLPEGQEFLTRLRVFQAPSSCRRELAGLIGCAAVSASIWRIAPPASTQPTGRFCRPRTLSMSIFASRSPPATSLPQPVSAPTISAGNSARRPVSACMITWFLSVFETPPSSF